MPESALLLAGIGLCGLTLWALRGGLRSPGGTTVVGMDPSGLVMAALAVGAAIFLFGPLYGLAVTLVVAIHEFGHVAAYRVAGHHDARFRLIPLMGGVAISDRLPATQTDDFFITLMGPAIGIGPMILAYGLVPVALRVDPQLAEFLLVFGAVCGALNFLNMLPFWPLDGGRMLRIIAYAFWPPAATILTTMMCAALISAAIALQSFVLFFFALMGASSLMSADDIAHRQVPLGRARAVLALAAYLAVAATLFMGGMGLILRYI